LSARHPVRLRVTLAILVLVIAGTTVGAAALLGSNQEAPVTIIDATAVAPTGPAVPVAGLDENPTGAETPAPGMRLGVLDKEEAIQEERQARSDARALRALAAQQASIFEFVAALADAQAVAAAAPTGPPVVPDPAPTSAGGNTPDPVVGGGGGNLSLYEKLDNIAICESGQNPRAVREPYFGAFQFLWETWQTWGGGGSRPRDILDHSYAAQREVAANLAQARGFAGSWPTCAARYGYT
jgi:hypothetical protein